MSLPLKISAIALEEITEIQRTLERGTEGAGTRFRDDLVHCLRIVLQFPRGAQVRHGIYRTVPIESFGYHVIYSMRKNCIVVHRVRHMQRKPLKRYFG